MKITNKIGWRTDHLRKIVHRVAEDELDGHERKMLHITFAPNGMFVTKPGARHHVSDVRDAVWQLRQRYELVIFCGPREYPHPERVAWRVAVNLLKTQPENVQRERRQWDRYRSYLPYVWAMRYPLTPAPKRKAARPRGTELQRHRYKLVLAAEERWTKKLQQAQRRLAKLRKKRKYYERILKPDGPS